MYFPYYSTQFLFYFCLKWLGIVWGREARVMSFSRFCIYTSIDLTSFKFILEKLYREMMSMFVMRKNRL
jgi:hypothetical protein